MTSTELRFSDIETREALKRIRYATNTFGKHEGDASDVNLYEASDATILNDFILPTKAKEFKKAAWYKTSPQIKYRKTMIEFMMKVCSMEMLTTHTTYQAIYMLDRFMDKHDVANLDHLPVLGIVCIVLTGKLLEADRSVPKYQRYCSYIHGCMKQHMQVAVAFEKFVLQFFKYNIIIPTEINFLEVFLLYSVDGINTTELCGLGDNNNNKNNNNNQMMPNANNLEPEQSDTFEVQLYSGDRLPGASVVKAIQNTALLILQELTREDPQNNFPPSMVAAAIMLAARREHSLNFWTPKLQEITTYSLAELLDCLINYVQPKGRRARLRTPFVQPEFRNVVLVPSLVHVLGSDSESETESETSQ